MKTPRRKLRVTLVDLMVGVAVLMILSALIIPIFVPPEGKAASRATVPATSALPAQR